MKGVTACVSVSVLKALNSRSSMYFMGERVREMVMSVAEKKKSLPRIARERRGEERCGSSFNI
jgi:hypothetical protein